MRDPQTALLIQRIRKACRQLAGRDRPVWIADLRPEIGGTRAQQDAALIAIAQDRDVVVEPESDQKILRQYQRDGCLRMGNEDKHWIIIS